MTPDESLALAAHVYGLQKAARILSQRTAQSYLSILQYLVYDGVATALNVSPEQMEQDLSEMLRIAHESGLSPPIS